jgi:hypothetical protein
MQLNIYYIEHSPSLILRTSKLLSAEKQNVFKYQTDSNLYLTLNKKEWEISVCGYIYIYIHTHIYCNCSTYLYNHI